MIVKLLTEHNLKFLSLKGGCRGSSESTHVKMPHCWKSHVTAQIIYCINVPIGLQCVIVVLLTFQISLIWKPTGSFEAKIYLCQYLRILYLSYMLKVHLSACIHSNLVRIDV